MSRRIMPFVLLLAAWACPAGAAERAPAPLPSEEPAMPILAQVPRAADDAERLALLDRALEILVQPTALRGAVLCDRGSVLQQLYRADEARRALDACRQLRPDDPRVLMMIAMDESNRQHPVEATRLFIRATLLQPDLIDAIPISFIDTLLRQLDYGRGTELSDALIDRLAEAGVGRTRPGAFSDILRRAMQNRLAAGKTDAARALLPSILDPAAGVRMLIDRRFEPLWPAIEQWAGGDLSVQRRAFLAAARAAFQVSGTTEAHLAYADALVATGNRSAAIDTIDTMLGNETKPDEAWDRTSSVIKQARWLAESGTRPEAIARLRAVLSARAAPYEGVENVVPNLAVHLLMANDHRAVLTLLDTRTPPLERLDSAVAAAIFVALRACAIEGLRRHDEAVALLRRIETQFPTADAAHDKAVACVASPDEQARRWIDGANDPVRRNDALIALTKARYRLRLNLPALSLESRALLRIAQREDVRRTFDALARALPPSYEPALDRFEGVPLRQPASGATT